MSIIRPDQEVQRPLKLIALSDAPAETLEYPKRERRSGASMAGILWTLLLVFGILILLVSGPLRAPPFESLTQYVCDPLPSLPNLGNRLQQYRLRLTCRAGGQVVYQSQPVSDGSNPDGLRTCKREGGLTRIWRMAPPDAHGVNVFHATCGDHIIMLYKNRAANYESTQCFIISLACALITLSTASLLRKWFRRALRRQLERGRQREGSADS